MYFNHAQKRKNITTRWMLFQPWFCISFCISLFFFSCTFFKTCSTFSRHSCFIIIIIFLIIFSERCKERCSLCSQLHAVWPHRPGDAAKCRLLSVLPAAVGPRGGGLSASTCKWNGGLHKFWSIFCCRNLQTQRKVFKLKAEQETELVLEWLTQSQGGD